MPRARLGVVLPLPAPAASEVDGLRRALGGVSPDRVVPHVTLVPPVNVRVDTMVAAIEVVRDVAAAVPPFRVVLGPPATFWPDTPVVHLAVGGAVEQVERLHDAFSGGPWARPTTFPYVPHVTIAHDVDPAMIPAALALLGAYRREVTLSTVQVLEEQADRSWRVLADVALAGRRVVARGGLEVVIEAGDVLDDEAAAALDATWIGHVASSYGPIPGRRPFAVSARREGAVVAAAHGSTDDELWLGRIAVDAAVRGQGVGRHLLRAVESLGAERGCGRAFLVCRADSPSRGWYRDQGWREDLELPGWRHGRAFVRMRRDL